MSQSTLTTTIEDKLHLLFTQQKMSLENGLAISKELFLELSQKEGIKWYQLLLGQAALNKQEYSTAKQIANIIIQDPESTVLLCAEALNILGIIARLHRLIPDALKFYNQAEKYFIAGNNSIGKIRMDYNIANIDLLQSEIKHAISKYKALLLYISELEKKDSLNDQILDLKGNIIQSTAIALMYNGEFIISADYFEQGLKIAQRIKSLLLQADISLNFANLMRIQDNVPRAKTLFAEASQLYHQIGQEELSIKAFIDYAYETIVHDKTTPIETSLIEKLLNNWKVATGNDVPLRMYEIAQSLFLQEKINESEQIALELFKKTLQPDMKGRILYLLVQIAFYKRQFQQVIEIGQEVLDISVKLKDKSSEMAIRGTLLLANYQLNKNFSTAKEQLIQILEELKTIKDNNAIIDLCEEFYPIVFTYKEGDTLISLIEKYEFPIAKRGQNLNTLKILYSDLIIINLFLTGDAKKAKEYLNKSKLSDKEIVNSTRFKNFLPEENIIKQKLQDLSDYAGKT